MSVTVPSGRPLSLGAEILAELRRQTALLEQVRRERSTPILLSKREAARRLGFSRGRTLDALLASGELRAKMVGKRLKIPLAEIERYLSKTEPQPTSVPARRASVPRKTAERSNVALFLKRQGF